MQTIYLDISNKGVIPAIYAKQGDVGRRFLVVLTDAGVPYSPPAGSAFSVWYDGDSGEGNYTDIGDASAFSVNANTVFVELITQMLEKDGEGVLCLVLSHADGKQIGSWNIPYVCEHIPGFESEEATSYYTAFSETVANLQKLVETDPTVPAWAKQPQKPAYTAVEVGARPNTWMPTASDVGAAPAGYGLGENTAKVLDANAINKTGFYVCDTNTPDSSWWYGVHVQYHPNYAYQEFCCYSGTASHVFRKKVAGTWSEWEWINPPMTLGVEYRTTERYKGKAVYTKLINFGNLPNATHSGIANGVNATLVIRCEGVTSNGYTLPRHYNGDDIDLCADLGWILITTNKDYSSKTADIQIWYTKD